jgi:hypothetical protein
VALLRNQNFVNRKNVGCNVAIKIINALLMKMSVLDIAVIRNCVMEVAAKRINAILKIIATIIYRAE